MNPVVRMGERMKKRKLRMRDMEKATLSMRNWLFLGGLLGLALLGSSLVGDMQRTFSQDPTLMYLELFGSRIPSPIERLVSIESLFG